MRPNLGRLRIERIIVHDVPKRFAGDESGPRLSEVESTLDAELRTFFQERIKKSLASAAFDVMFDPETASPAPPLVFDQLGVRTMNFVDMSGKLAEHLYASQTGVNSAGLLTVVQAEIDGLPCLGVLKLEREAGVRLEETDQGGLRTFDIHHVKDLMLTDKTKVFKACVFVQNGADMETVAGLMSDHQRGTLPRREVADFFLKKFLGCQLREAPEVTTKRFFSETQEFINKRVAEPERKAQYLTALVATLNNNDPALSPAQFAATNLIGPDRQGLVGYLEEAGVPTSHIDKDTSLIQQHLKRTRWGFESGLSLIGPPESFEQHVVMVTPDDGEPRTEIRDTLKDVHA